MRRQVVDLQLAYPVERSESVLLEAGEVVVVEAQNFQAAQRWQAIILKIFWHDKSIFREPEKMKININRRIHGPVFFLFNN